MKKILILCLLTLPLLSIAQSNEVAKKKAAIKYSLMVVLGPEKRSTIQFDVGNGFEKLKDGTGKEMRFKSETDALNYVVSLGWEIVDTIKRKVDFYTDEVVCYVLKQNE